MLPKRNSDIRELLIEVEPKSLSLARLTIIKQGNARLDFLLQNVQENAVIADTVFAFIPPAGVQVRQQ